MSKNPPVTHVFVVIWRLVVRVFDLLCGLFFVFPLHSRARLCLMMGLTFFWPAPWFSLFPTILYCYSCRNNLILLGLFWVSRVFLLSVAWHGHCFTFTYELLCPFGFSFGHPRPVCFLWASSPHLLIPHSHGLFTNFIGLPWPNNLILILRGLWACHKPFTFLVYITLSLRWPFLTFLPHTLPMGCYFFLSELLWAHLSLQDLLVYFLSLWSIISAAWA